MFTPTILGDKINCCRCSSRVRYSPSSPYRPESRGAHRCWSCHEVTCRPWHWSMIRCPASSAAHQSDAVNFDVENSGRRASPITTRLREQCADWSARILGEMSAVGAHCSKLQLVWSTDSGVSTMSLKLYCRCNGCVSISDSNWQSWSTEFYTPVRRLTVGAIQVRLGQLFENSSPADITCIDVMSAGASLSSSSYKLFVLARAIE